MAACLPYRALTDAPPPRRVAIVASHAPSLILFRQTLLGDIAARGHTLLCAAPDFDAATEARLRDLGAETRTVPVARTGLNPFADIATLRALTHLFRQFRPDVVMGYTSKPAIYASLAARRAGAGHVSPMITGLGYAFLEGGGVKGAFVRALMTRLYRQALRASDGVIFHNADDAKMMKDLGVVPPGLRVTVVRGSGVDLAHYEPRPLPSATDRLTFLMITRLVRYKGVAEYCEAARLLRREGANARFLLVGPEEPGPAGFPLSELEAYSDAVTWLGPRDDVRQTIADAHVYVLPSYGEGMPRTVLEAMAMARPIITTDARGCRETVRDGVNGRLVPIRDPRALAGAMREMISCPECLGAMGAESRRLAEAEFDVARVNAAMLKALHLDNA